MKQTITLKAKLLKDDIPEFVELTNVFKDACNFISEWIFNNDFILSRNKVQKFIYKDIREKYHLKSQMAISAIQNVVTQYKTINTTYKKHPYKVWSGKYDNSGKKIYLSFKRNLGWLEQPISFDKPQVILQENRDWTFVKNQVSINTLKNRIKLNYVCKDVDKYQNNWKFGTASLQFENNTWYMLITATKEQVDYNISTTKHIVGIDRGLRFLATCYDEQGKTIFFSGKDVLKKHRYFKHLRAQLQSKNTKSAKRRLKQIGNRESKWMKDVNHKITKQLIDTYGENTLFVLEDLDGITFATEKKRKREKRYEHSSWSFYQFEEFLTYKANLHNCKVVKVNPIFTSQRCPKCGSVNKKNRDHKLHLYTCNKCGYKSNDDRIAAMNIQQLGSEYISGNLNPHYSNR